MAIAHVFRPASDQEVRSQQALAKPASPKPMAGHSGPHQPIMVEAANGPCSVPSISL